MFTETLLVNNISIFFRLPSCIEVTEIGVCKTEQMRRECNLQALLTIETEKEWIKKLALFFISKTY